jgi:putative ABC transport system permease protein
MDSLAQDLRFAFRAIRRRPAFAVSAILSLTIAIAATTSVFSLVNAALFKDVPGVRRPQRLVEIARDVGGEGTDVTFGIYSTLREQSRTLSDVAAFALAPASITSTGEPSVRGALAVTASYFDMLGVLPARGRLFARGEADYPVTAPVVVISHDVWQRELAGASDVIGRIVRINGAPVEVIGVLPPGFAGHHTGLLLDVFVPLGAAIPGMPNAAGNDKNTALSLEVLGRLREGITLAHAARELSAAADRTAQSTGEATPARPYKIRVDAWGPLPAAIRSVVATFLVLLLAIVALALVMACVNISTVLLARGVERQRELAVRRAIGARQSRIVRQILSEVAVLFVLAGVGAIFVSMWATSLLHGLTPTVPIPGRLGADFGFDFRVLGFAIILTLGACVAFSLLPALQSSRGQLAPALREGAASETRGRARLRAAMVAVQVAVTSVLLSATLLFGRALLTMRSLEPAWNPNGVFVTEINLELNGTARERGPDAQRAMLAALNAKSEIEMAALATKLPMGGRSSFGLVSVPGVEPPANGLPGFDAALNRVSPRYFQTMQIPLLRGRDFQSSDVAGSQRVAVIGASMARRIWGERDPLGATFFVGSGQNRPEFVVVGIVADAQLTAPGRTPDNFYYVPLAQWYSPDAHLHVRTRAGFEGNVTPAVRSAVREVDATLPLLALRPLSEALGVRLLPQRLAAAVAAAMGVFGLLLATIGIYGVTAFLVSRRAREFAIRVALGATSRQITALVIGHGGRAPLAGLLLGLAVSFTFSMFIGKVIIGVTPGDPVVFVVIPVALGTVALAAMLVPLRALARSSPMARLREE